MMEELLIDLPALVNFLERLVAHLVVNHCRKRQKGSNRSIAYHGILLPLDWMMVSVVKTAPTDFRADLDTLITLVASVEKIMKELCASGDGQTCRFMHRGRGIWDMHDETNISLGRM